MPLIDASSGTINDGGIAQCRAIHDLSTELEQVLRHGEFHEAIFKANEIQRNLNWLWANLEIKIAQVAPYAPAARSQRLYHEEPGSFQQGYSQGLHLRRVMYVVGSVAVIAAIVWLGIRLEPTLAHLLR